MTTASASRGRTARVSLGTPNACNQCHADRNAQWAVAEIRKRYPDPKPGFQGFAEAFAAADRGDPPRPSRSRRWLPTWTSRPLRAPRRSSGWPACPARTRCSPRRRPSMTRARWCVARRSTCTSWCRPGSDWRSLPLLSDPSRIVRMQAAHTLAPVPEQALDPAASAGVCCGGRRVCRRRAIQCRPSRAPYQPWRLLRRARRCAVVRSRVPGRARARSPVRARLGQSRRPDAHARPRRRGRVVAARRPREEPACGSPAPRARPDLRAPGPQGRRAGRAAPRHRTRPVGRALQVRLRRRGRRELQ